MELYTYLAVVEFDGRIFADFFALFFVVVEVTEVAACESGAGSIGADVAELTADGGSWTDALSKVAGSSEFASGAGTWSGVVGTLSVAGTLSVTGNLSVVGTLSMAGSSSGVWT